MDRTLHENHENWYTTKIKPSTVYTKYLFIFVMPSWISAKFRKEFMMACPCCCQPRRRSLGQILARNGTQFGSTSHYMARQGSNSCTEHILMSTYQEWDALYRTCQELLYVQWYQSEIHCIGHAINYCVSGDINSEMHSIGHARIYCVSSDIRGEIHSIGHARIYWMSSDIRSEIHCIGHAINYCVSLWYQQWDALYRTCHDILYVQWYQEWDTLYRTCHDILYVQWYQEWDTLYRTCHDILYVQWYHSKIHSIGHARNYCMSSDIRGEIHSIGHAITLCVSGEYQKIRD